MKILFGANMVRQPLEARRWIEELGQSLFYDLTAWVTDREPKWGECYIFFEVSVPPPKVRPRVRNQIDMLVSFDAQVAICEVKSHPADLSDGALTLAVEQINGQSDWVSGVLHDGSFRGASSSMRKYLVLTRLSGRQIADHEARLIHPLSAPHIWPVGAARAGHRYLISDLYRFGDWDTSGPGLRSAGRFLYEEISKRSELRGFATFEHARAYLTTLTPSMQVLQDPWYVPGLRPDALDEIIRLNSDVGICEVAGPPGIGKSTLVKELINLSGGEFFEVRLTGCRTVGDVCAAVYASSHGSSGTGLGDEQFVNLLANEETLFWISSYDHESTSGLDRFIQLVLRRTVGRASLPSRWVIESVEPRPALSAHRVELGPLDGRMVSGILESVPTANDFDLDLEQISSAARGNPGRAIHLWQRQGHSQTHLPQFDWFTSRLSSTARQLLRVLCVVLSRSPFGVTAEALRAYGEALSSALRETICEAAEELVAELEFCQLACIARIDAQRFVSEVRGILPSEHALTILRDLHPDLLSSQLKGIPPTELVVFENGIQNAMLASANGTSLSDVNLGFMLGSLDEFIRSSFRFSMLSVVVPWLDRRGDAMLDPRQRYLSRGLRVLLRVSENPSWDWTSELPHPAATDSTACYLWSIIKARAIGGRVNLGSDPEQEVALLAAEPDSEIRVEGLASIANALEGMQDAQRPNRHAEAWAILERLPDEAREGTPAWALATQQVLAFLNRKSRRFVIDDADAARELVERHARALVAVGFESQNLQLVCDALFYYVRSRELLTARTSYADVVGLRSALRFVGAAQWRRGRRIQLLLTEGSLHRHFCTQPEIGWGEFRQHLEDGLYCYRLALRSAVAQRRPDHVRTAISYMMDLCIKAASVVHDVAGASVLSAVSQSVITVADQVAQLTETQVRGTESAITLRAIHLSYPLVYLLSCTRSHRATPVQRHGLREAFSRLANVVRETVSQGADVESRKALQMLLKRMQRCFSFEATYRGPGADLFVCVRSPIGQILRTTAKYRGLSGAAWSDLLVRFITACLPEKCRDVGVTEHVIDQSVELCKRTRLPCGDAKSMVKIGLTAALCPMPEIPAYLQRVETRYSETP
jgi:hypothetical protein